MKTIDLKALCPPGYGRASIYPGPTNDVSCDVLLDHLAKEGCPVLEMAEGPAGVLRAMDLPGRRPGIQAELADSGKEVTIIHFVPLEDCGALHCYTVKLSRR
jgi:hypothetical protein|tara:strand:+ start:3857 stop:4162 length:306 start_codon:yes stop_codon:yes gene_type:complete